MPDTPAQGTIPAPATGLATTVSSAVFRVIRTRRQPWTVRAATREEWMTRMSCSGLAGSTRC